MIIISISSVVISMISDPSQIIALFYQSVSLNFVQIVGFVKVVTWISQSCYLDLPNCSSQPSMVHWLSSPIFPCLFGCPAMVTSSPPPPPSPSSPPPSPILEAPITLVSPVTPIALFDTALFKKMNILFE